MTIYERITTRVGGTAALTLGALLASSLATPAHAQLGSECTPGEAAPQDGLECLPAFGADGTPEWVLDPAHLLNARRGDAVLSQGCGMIGNLLRQVDPPQYYSHSGIMVTDRYAVRHNTASETRIEDYPVGSHLGEPAATDGHRPDVVKYGWPGSVTQSVQGAYEGEYLQDPESRDWYRIHGFNDRPGATCLDQTPPVVIKPPPEAELDDPSLRQRVQAAAGAAEGLDSHYRFYGYTLGSIPGVAPASAGWAEGTFGSVCSSFVWTALQKAGVHLEGPLEEEDCAADAAVQVVPGASCAPGQSMANAAYDGLYYYTAAERTVAVEWLYDHFYDAAYEEGGAGSAFLYDAPDDIASQLANCFAFDWCGPDDVPTDIDGTSGVAACSGGGGEPEDSDCYESPGPGLAVSPDDMLRWDGPETGGVYGYEENLAMRPTDYVRVYRWASAEDRGTVTGVTRAYGSTEAEVRVAVGGVPDYSDATGAFAVGGLPAGTHLLQACKEVGDGLYLTGEQQVTVVAGEETSVVVDLVQSYACAGGPSTKWTRDVTVQGDFTVVDDEWAPVSDEVDHVQVDAETVTLQPLTGQDAASFSWTKCTGDEVIAVIDLETWLDIDKEQTLMARLHVRMYEGTSCDSDDKDAELDKIVEVAPGTTLFFNEHVVSCEWESDDSIDIQLAVSNVQASM